MAKDKVSISIEIEKIGRGLEDVRREIKDLGDQVKSEGGRIRAETSQIKSGFQGIKKAILAIGPALLAVFSARALLRAAENWVELSNRQEKAVAGLHQSMVSMGRYTPEFERKILDLASAYQDLTTFGDEAIIKGSKFLMTYKDIGNEVMPRAMRAMTDIAALMGGDMTSAANMVGKASMGMVGELRRAGITVDAAAAKGKGFVGILEQIEQQVSGQAMALRRTGYGGLEAFKNLVGDFKERLGDLIKLGLAPLAEELIGPLKAAIESVQKKVEELKESGKLDEWAQKTANVIEMMFGKAASQLKEFHQISAPIIKDLWNTLKIILDGFKALPHWVQEVGLLAAFLFGKKGFLVAAGAAAWAGTLKYIFDVLMSEQAKTTREMTRFSEEVTITLEKIRRLEEQIAAVKNQRLSYDMEMLNEALAAQKQHLVELLEQYAQLTEKYSDLKREPEELSFPKAPPKLEPLIIPPKTTEVADEYMEKLKDLYLVEQDADEAAKQLNKALAEQRKKMREAIPKEIIEGWDLFGEAMDGAKVHLKEMTDEMEGIWGDFQSNLQWSLEAGFFDLFKGGIDDMGDFFKQFCTGIYEAFARAVSKMIAEWIIFGNITGERKTTGTGGLLGGIASLISGIITSFQYGGIIPEPVFGVGKSGRGYLFGEAGQEIVAPVRAFSTTASQDINIYLVDDRAKVPTRSDNDILLVVAKDIRGDGVIRKTIKRFT